MTELPEAGAEFSAGTAPPEKSFEFRAFLGAIALTLRTALSQLIILGGMVVLARNLTPSDFGAFAMLQFALTALTVFGDAGLAGALIQKAEAPTQRELSSVFWVQFGLGVVAVLLSGAVGPLLPIFWPDLPAGSPWILVALGINFAMTSLRVTPMLLMERELLFIRVAVIDTINSVMFYLVAGGLALSGARIWALVVGVLAQGAAGLLGAFILRPWRPSFEFDREAIRRLLGFGIHVQTRTALGLVIAAVIPMVGGSVLGSRAVGLINWAHQTAFFPLTFVDIIARVSFPLYSRLQGTPERFALAVSRSLTVSAVITFFLSAMFLGMGVPLTVIIYSDTWLEAVPLLFMYAGTITLGMLVNVLSPVFDAVGKPRVVVFQLIVVSIGTWICVPIGTHLWGIEGFTLGYVSVMVLGGFVIAWLAFKFLPPIDLFRPFRAPLIAGCLTFLLGRLVLTPYIEGPITLTLAVLLAIVFFASIVVLLDRSIVRTIRALRAGGESAESV